MQIVLVQTTTGKDQVVSLYINILPQQQNHILVIAKFTLLILLSLYKNAGRDIVLISPKMTNWQLGYFHLIIGDILVAMWSNGLICNNYQTREGIRFLNVEHAPAWLRMLIILQRICVN